MILKYQTCHNSCLFSWRFQHVNVVGTLLEKYILTGGLIERAIHEWLPTMSIHVSKASNTIMIH